MQAPLQRCRGLGSLVLLRCTAPTLGSSTAASAMGPTAALVQQQCRACPGRLERNAALRCRFEDIIAVACAARPQSSAAVGAARGAGQAAPVLQQVAVPTLGACPRV